jgi:hypothetical protein
VVTLPDFLLVRTAEHHWIDGVQLAIIAAVAVFVGRERLGLVGMRERASLLAGRLAIETEPGRGTTVEATIPRLDSGAPLGAFPTRPAGDADVSASAR